MKKVGKRIVWGVSLLLLISVMGCSLKIDIDPDRLREAEPSQPEEARQEKSHDFVISW